MKLENSEIFKKDLERYNRELSRISQIDAKNKLEYLIRSLISEIRYLDSQHDELNVNKSLPNTITDSRSKIKTIRTQIENLIK